MSQEIVLVSEEDLKALADRAGAVQSGSNFLPQLRVNYEDETPEGISLKKGTFFVADQDEAVYANTVTFRPLTQHFQWVDYDEVQEKTVNRTRFIANFKEEARDEKGGVRCGKPSSKELKANPNLAKQYESITCYRHLQGIVKYTGKTAAGVETEVENVVSLRLKGSNFSLLVS